MRVARLCNVSAARWADKWVAGEKAEGGCSSCCSWSCVGFPCDVCGCCSWLGVPDGLSVGIALWTVSVMPAMIVAPAGPAAASPRSNVATISAAMAPERGPRPLAEPHALLSICRNSRAGLRPCYPSWRPSAMLQLLPRPPLNGTDARRRSLATGRGAITCDA
eukprot:scaffold225_cov388-Prasinococcus_capsulatus_cf.AAC.31